MPLIEWLREQLDADEQVALEAAPGPWVYQDVESVGGGRICDATVEIANLSYDPPGEVVDPRIHRARSWQEADGTGAHIAAWDPARVLAEVKAKRAILDQYEKTIECRKLHPDDLACAGAVLSTLAVVGLIAQPYAERDGWQTRVERGLMGDG